MKTKLDRALLDALVLSAKAVRAHAYAPYSKYRVGAALVTGRGEMFVGCNVENATYGATICAERAAVCAMVAAGAHDPIACVVATAGPEPGTPCGICRQVLAEMARDMKIVLVADRPRGKRVETSLATLLPNAFRLLPPPR